VLTGRKEKHREITEQWLYDNDFMIDEVIMQSKPMAEKNHIFKEKELIKLQERYDIVAMFDDNTDLIPVCKKL
jgi:hypothetical protein